MAVQHVSTRHCPTYLGYQSIVCDYIQLVIYHMNYCRNIPSLWCMLGKCDQGKKSLKCQNVKSCCYKQRLSEVQCPMWQLYCSCVESVTTAALFLPGDICPVKLCLKYADIFFRKTFGHGHGYIIKAGTVRYCDMAGHNIGDGHHDGVHVLRI